MPRLLAHMQARYVSVAKSQPTGDESFNCHYSLCMCAGRLVLGFMCGGQRIPNKNVISSYYLGDRIRTQVITLS